MTNVIKRCGDLGVDYYITHLGSTGQKVSKEKVVIELEKACTRILESVNPKVKTKLLLETSPGSSSGTKVGTLEELLEVRQSLKSERVGICLDTEHAFANGLDLNQLDLDEIGSKIDVVHLNSIPEAVELNSHLDRHGKTALKDSKNSVIESLKRITCYFNSRDVPLILERSGKKIIEKDLQYLVEICTC